MPIVVFEPVHPSPAARASSGGESSDDARDHAADAPASLEVAAPDGGALADVCDDAGAAVPFSCRSANCGTCRIVVLEGASELLPPDDEELDVLHLFGAPEAHRLACCVKMRPGIARLRVRPVADDE